MDKNDPREVFEFVKAHLIKQGECAMYRNEDGLDTYCAYRGSNGTKCAVGCLISDEEYDQRMEQNSVDALIELFPALSWMKPHEDLLNDLQAAHDMLEDMGPVEYQSALRRRLDRIEEEYLI